MECGPCLLEPVLGEVLHGPHSANIEILTLAELCGLKGYYGNFQAAIRQAPRYVDAEQCVGCGECIPPCPVSAPNEFNFGLDTRHAIALPFPGALPNAPFLDARACLRSRAKIERTAGLTVESVCPTRGAGAPACQPVPSQLPRGQGEECTLCRDACPVEDVIRYTDAARTLERPAGAVVVAAGFGLYDCRNLPELGYGTVPGVYTSLEFERILASSGPTGGELSQPGGAPAGSVAIVHCAGSLEERHRPYCSGICCSYAFKFDHLIEKKLPGAKVYHLYRELVVPGKEEFALYEEARRNPHAGFIRYAPGGVRVTGAEGGATVEYQDPAGNRGSVTADMVVLCPALTGAADAADLSRLLGATLDRFGFFAELHGRMDSAQSGIKGIYVAGACQAPMDISRAVSQGMSAAGYVLSGLADGKKLEIQPITAVGG